MAGSIDAHPSLQINAPRGTVTADITTVFAGEDAARDVQKIINEYSYTVINANGATTVKSSAGAYAGYRILGNAGSLTMDVYDNTAASGQKLEPQVSVSAAADGRRSEGVRFTTGLTVNMSGDPTDGLILVYWK